jgi:hypothetical protein
VQRKRLPVSVQRSQSERHFQEGMSQRLTNIDTCKLCGQRSHTTSSGVVQDGVVCKVAWES